MRPVFPVVFTGLFGTLISRARGLDVAELRAIDLATANACRMMPAHQARAEDHSQTWDQL